MIRRREATHLYGVFRVRSSKFRVRKEYAERKEDTEKIVYHTDTEDTEVKRRRI
jgi:hypothetical protein